MHNGSGGCTAIPSKTIGAARAAHNRTNSHGMRISHARRGQAVLQFEQTYLALQRQHGPVPCHATCNMGGRVYRFATAGMHMQSESRRRPPTCRAEPLPSLSHLCWAMACLSFSCPAPSLNGVLSFLPDPSLPRLCRPCRPLEPGKEVLVLPQRQPPWIAISQPLHVRLLRLPVQHLHP